MVTVGEQAAPHRSVVGRVALLQGMLAVAAMGVGPRGESVVSESIWTGPTKRIHPRVTVCSRPVTCPSVSGQVDRADDGRCAASPAVDRIVGIRRGFATHPVGVTTPARYMRGKTIRSPAGLSEH